MRIGIIAPPWLPVPPPAYGGTEAVVDGLVHGLARAGHDVVLFAHPASTSPAELRTALPEETTHVIGLGTTELAHVLAAYAELDDVDVIHDHTMSGPLLGPTRTTVPVVTTHHGTFDDACRRIFRQVAHHASVIAISHCQAAAAGDIPIAAVVHHGLDVADIPLGTGDGGYLAFLGRMVPEKGAHRAIAIARRAGLPLRIAAKMREPAEQAYFEEMVRPQLGGEIEYVGELGASDKLDLLGGATALLNPIDWPEPFGMVMLEALACGTPVVASRAGAAPEIVAHGTVGFLARSDRELVAAVTRVGDLDRLTCRTWAAQRFSLELMAKAYEEQYLVVADPSLRGPRVGQPVPMGTA
jgi:glycosyltransferase involved in cell wall biosynthesis